MTTTKKCIACAATKPASEFSRDAQKPDGLNPYCRPCDASRRRPLRASRQPSSHPVSVDTKQCSRCGQEKPATAFRKNTGALSGLYHCCRGCTAAEMRERRAQPDVMARDAEARRARRDAVLAHYGGLCECCGESRREFLAVSRIGGDSAKHRKAINCPLVEWLLREGMPDGFRVLCHNCNGSIGFYGFCPHSTR